MNFFRHIFNAVLVLLLGLCASVALAQEKTGTRDGFELKPGTARIILMQPNIRVGDQSTGGMFEPNADWTAQARENIERELARVQSDLGNEIIAQGDLPEVQAASITQYSNLFSSVAESVIEYQFFRGNRLPTKKNQAFEWGMGKGLSEIDALAGGDYLLFISTHDAYGSTGRKLLQFAGLLAGVPVVAGEHAGYAGLIERTTGALVWLNADLAMGGDVRTAEGAQKRVTQLLEGFPGRKVTDGGDK